ncbi:MAG: hypothetical protein JNM62_02200 [Flavobacteriales bacterium]|nr:hypothetical protein [Flavobacteriales bacterium]
MQPVDVNYELTDHLGNVTAVVTGRLLDGNGGGTLKQPELLSAQGYEPFGSLLPGRNYNSGSSRHLFQGQEHDDEINGGIGLNYAFEYRMHDPRVGRFWSIDPLAPKYPHNSPYAFSENRVIDRIELEGLETAVISQYHVLANGETKLQATSAVENAGNWTGNQYFEQYLVLADVNKNGPVLYNDYNEATKTWEHGRAAVEMHKGQVKREPFKSKVDYGQLHESFANSHEGKNFYNTLQNVPAVAGLALGVGAVVEGTAGVLTYAGLVADTDQLTGASDNIDNPELRAAIKLTELGFSAASLTTNTYEAVTAMRATYQTHATVEAVVDAAGTAADGASVREAMEMCQD